MPDTLVLDMYWKPRDFTTWENAVKLIWEDRAQVVKEDEGGRQLHSPSFTMGMPRVIMVKNAWRRKRRTSIPLSRRNLWMRDNGTCQYCGHELTLGEMQIEHVIPRCQKGATVWENVVAACLRCNKRKDNKTPKQAGMPLLKQPVAPKPDDPKYNFTLHVKKIRPEWEPWQEWLYAEKHSWAYWNVSLEE